ncbi:hypothetical protein ACFE04_029427 [Oxalis oulophora]
MIVENDSFFFGSNERWDLMFWICAFLMNTALFATNLHQLTCLADLEDDYMNPFETAGRVNAWIMPEFYLQGFFCAYFLVTGHWFLFLCAFPLLCYHVNMVIKRQHMLDVTEVFRNIKFEKRMRIVKMGFYVFPFFIIMIKLLIAIFNKLEGMKHAVHVFLVSVDSLIHHAEKKNYFSL